MLPIICKRRYALVAPPRNTTDRQSSNEALVIARRGRPSTAQTEERPAGKRFGDARDQRVKGSRISHGADAVVPNVTRCFVVPANCGSYGLGGVVTARRQQ